MARTVCVLFFDAISPKITTETLWKPFNFNVSTAVPPHVFCSKRSTASHTRHAKLSSLLFFSLEFLFSSCYWIIIASPLCCIVLKWHTLHMQCSTPYTLHMECLSNIIHRFNAIEHAHRHANECKLQQIHSYTMFYIDSHSCAR